MLQMRLVDLKIKLRRKGYENKISPERRTIIESMRKTKEKREKKDKKIKRKKLHNIYNQTEKVRE